MKPVEPIPIVKLNDTLLDLLAALRPPIAWEAVAWNSSQEEGNQRKIICQGSIARRYPVTVIYERYRTAIKILIAIWNPRGKVIYSVKTNRFRQAVKAVQDFMEYMYV